MDLALTPAQLELAAAARTAFTAGGAAPVVTGALGDLVVVARELGRAAVPSTFHTEVLARLLGWQRPGLAAVAVEVVDVELVDVETAADIETAADVEPGLAATGGTGRPQAGAVTGVAGFVAHATEADVLLVRTGADRIVEIDLRGAGVSIRPQPTIGDDGCCEVTLAAAPAVAGHACDVEAAVARAAVVLAADAVGAAEAALDAAVAHVRERHQWGAPLGALQAVQHRCAGMLIDLTLAADAVLDAAGIADRGEPEAEVRLAASYAKATAIERCRRITADAHQLAGGQGILADRPFHRWYRRVKAAEPALGDARHHRAVVAAALIDGPAPG